jgi:hypothetical protein
MDLKSFLATSLERSTAILKMTVADLSDADLRERPVDNANPANWQIGHLINAQSFLFSEIGAPRFNLPAGFTDAYGGKGPATGGATLLSKADLLKLFDDLNAASVAWVRSLTPEQLAAPTPEKYRGIAPTVADMINMASPHNAMHVGQIQVLRRKLGKPVLF